MGNYVYAAEEAEDDVCPRTERPDIIVHLDDPTTIENQIRSITPTIFPGISESQLNITPITTGLMNYIYRIDISQPPRHLKNKSHLLCRIYGEYSTLFVDRPKETALFAELGHLSFGPQLYATFGNGRFEEFITEAHTIDITQSRLRPKLALRMAELHTFQPIVLENEKEPVVWGKIRKWLRVVEDVNPSDEVTRSKLEDLDVTNTISVRLGTLKARLEALQPGNKNNTNDMQSLAKMFMLECVFCHNDLHGENILYDEPNDRLYIIDYEHAGYNYRAFELANHFAELSTDLEFNTNLEFVEDFVETYIQALLTSNVSTISCVLSQVRDVFERDGDRQTFLKECVDIVFEFIPLSHLQFALAAVQALSVEDTAKEVDFVEFARIRAHDGYDHSLKLLRDRGLVS